MLTDGEIITCLHNQSEILNITPPSPIKLTREQLQIRHEEINKIYRETSDENNP